MRLKTRRKIIVYYTVFIYVMSLLAFSFVLPAVKAQGTNPDFGVPANKQSRVLMVDNRLVNVDYKKITSGTKTNDGSVLYYGAGGDLRAEKSSVAINTDLIVDYPMLDGGVDPENASNHIWIFHRKIPFEFDVNVWTSIPANYLVDSFRVSTSEESKAVAVRAYVGDKLSYDQEDHTGSAKTDTNSVSTSGERSWKWKPLGTSGNNKDGNNRFDTYNYYQAVVYAPFYIIGGQTITDLKADGFKDGDATSLGWNPYPQQLSLIQTKFNNNYILPNIDVTFSTVLDPLTAMPTTIDITNGQLSFKDGWVRFGGAEKVQTEELWGYCLDAADARNGFNSYQDLDGDGVPDENDSPSSDLEEQQKREEANSAIKNYYNSLTPGAVDVSHQSGMDGHISDDVTRRLTRSDLISAVPNYAASTLLGNDQKQPPNAIDIYSPSLGMTYQQAIASCYTSGSTTTIDKLSNVYDWEITLKNIRLVPLVTIYKQTYNLRYSEMWVNLNNGEDGIDYPHNSELSTWDTLLGWRIDNVYVHERMRFWVDVYSQYTIKTTQDPGADPQSHLPIPLETNGKMIWDLTPYGQQNFDFQYEDSDLLGGLANFLSGLADFFQKNWIWIIVAVIGVVIVVAILPRSAGSASAGYATRAVGPSSEVFIKEQQQTRQAQDMLATELEQLRENQSLLANELSKRDAIINELQRESLTTKIQRPTQRQQNIQPQPPQNP